MFCPNCGSRIDNIYQNFCHICGQEIPTSKFPQIQGDHSRLVINSDSRAVNRTGDIIQIRVYQKGKAGFYSITCIILAFASFALFQIAVEILWGIENVIYFNIIGLILAIISILSWKKARELESKNTAKRAGGILSIITTIFNSVALTVLIILAVNG